MSDVLSTMKRLFPNVRVTGGARDPNSRLGRANPRSYHNAGRAYDVAPLPGVRFPEFIDKLKGGGVNVVEARDEVSNPSKHATGPHWHFAYGDKPVKSAPLPRAKPSYPPQEPGIASDPFVGSPVADRSANANLQKGHKGLFPGKDWKAILGILGDGMLGYAGRQPIYGPMMAQQAEAEQQRNFAQEQLNAKIAADRQARMQPDIEQVGNNIVKTDPETGQVEVLYTAPPAEQAPTTLEREIAFYRQINPNATEAEIAQMVRQRVAAPPMPRMVTYNSGDTSVTEEIGPDGKRRPIAKAPRWQPKPGGSSLPSGFILDN